MITARFEPAPDDDDAGQPPYVDEYWRLDDADDDEDADWDPEVDADDAWPQ